MTLEILSIGNELLLGDTINSNTSVIGQALFSHGFPVDKVTFLPDEKTFLKKEIEEAMERASFVITTGGLGPTGDDLTRDIVSEIFNTSLAYDQAVASDLIERFGKNLPTLEDQAMVPKGATIIPNPLGTAPGFILEGKATVFVLPGVPAEMEVMLPAVIAHLEKYHTKSHYVAPLYLCLLSEQQVDPYLRGLEKENPDITMAICPNYGVLSVYVQGKDQQKIAAIRDQVAQKFETHVFSTELKQIEKALHQWLIKNKKSLAAAESCTGGELAACLTKHPGSSDYFLGSIVSYSNHLKEAVLGVSEKTLQAHGAVSEEVVLEMVAGAKKLSGADFAMATSGIAGPDGGTAAKPVGTVWTAISTPDKTFSGLISLKGSIRSRPLIIRYTVTYLLASLYRYLVYNTEPYA
ncbi:MAG: nicotinamide-nucleotide amidohydrolase family protein [Candidatus Neptunochlamydia sp.]|nr:nicotinamide-nucleotide amidohydrolase family protein [Candidatus Neptunochlamydia sp.]